MKIKLLAAVLIGFCGFGNSIFAQWSQTTGPCGGFTENIVNNGQRLFTTIGNYRSLYISDNEGASWTLKINDLAGARDIACDSNSVFYNGNGCIHESHDNGDTWTSNTSLFNLDSTLNIKTIAAKHPYVVIGTGSHDGVYFSSDYGLSWIQDTVGLPFNIGAQNLYHEIRDIMIVDSVIFICTYNFNSIPDEVYKKTLGSSSSWLNLSSGFANNFSCNSLNYDKITGSIYVAGFNGLYKSDDLGQTWISINVNPLFGTPYIKDIYVNNDSIWVVDDGIYFSNDLGNTWTLRTNGLYSQYLYTSEITIFNNKLFLASEYGIFRTQNWGNAWASRNNTLFDLTVYCVYNNNGDILAGTNNGIFKSLDQGQTWTWIGISDIFDAFYIYDINKIGSRLLAATSDGMYCSDDSGNSWIQCSNGISYGNYFGISSLQITNDTIYCSSQYSTYFSTDSANTWSTCFQWTFNCSCTCIRVYGQNVFGGRNCGPSGPFDVKMSDNYGQSFQILSIPTVLHEVVKKDSITVFGTSNGTFTSFNNGITFFNSANISGTTDLFEYNSLLLSCSEDSVYRSADFGITWGNFSDGLISPINSTGAAIDSNFIYLSTNSDGVWKRNRSEFVGIKNIPDLNNMVSISPNPATDKINISFPATAEQTITTKIFSITGEVVFGEENKTGNNYFNKTIDVAGLSNGIYFLSMQTGREVMTRKIVVNH